MIFLLSVISPANWTFALASIRGKLASAHLAYFNLRLNSGLFIFRRVILIAWLSARISLATIARAILCRAS
jgi:hypothetical protein